MILSCWNSLKMWQGLISYASVVFLLTIISISKSSAKPLVIGASTKIAATNDTTRIIELIKKSPQFKGDFDGNFDHNTSAIPYLEQALMLSEKDGYENLRLKTLELLSLNLHILKKYRRADSLAEIAISGRIHAGNEQAAASFMITLARHTFDNDSLEIKKARSLFIRALSIYRKSNDKAVLAKALQDFGFFSSQHGEVILGEHQLLEGIELYKLSGVKKRYKIYQLLALNYKMQGKTSKQLSSFLEMIANYEDFGDKKDGGYLYYQFSGFYQDMGQFKEAEVWTRKALLYTERYSDYYFYADYNKDLTGILLAQNRTAEALETLKENWKKYPKNDDWSKMVFYENFGKCYDALGQYRTAEHWYLMAYKLYNQARDYSAYQDLNIHKDLGEYYYHIRDFNKSSFYLGKALKVSPKMVKPRLWANLHLTAYKTDSAQNAYLSAINHLLIYHRISDSLSTIVKTGQIADMQVKYETSKKEQALRTEKKLREVEAHRLKLERVFTLCFTLIMLIIAATVYQNYINKKRAHALLEKQKEEINAQNEQLLSLIHDKDNLLDEKEWLLKEIHHRVKNNLQVVISLLNTQSVFLESEGAKVAIKESLNRIHAMSLIHQKLYSPEIGTKISMSNYVRDLIAYLQQSFNTPSRNINFNTNIPDIMLDVSLAIPLGLILNETVTNAIKYAFDLKGGQIDVRVEQKVSERIILMIKDNGKGFDTSYDRSKESFGMKMIKILSKQLDGIFIVESTDRGVTCHIDFPLERRSDNDDD